MREITKKKRLSVDREKDWINKFDLVCQVWFYGISTFVGYLTPNLFLCT